MKNWKTLVMGFVAGAACMIGTTALAAGMNVSAYLSGDITFNIDGKNVAQDGDMPVLNYNSRVYVPISFVAEQLGCTATWDVVRRQVVLTSPEPQIIEKVVEKEVEKIVYLDSSEDPNGNKGYSSLPVTTRTNEYELSITGVSRDEIDKLTKIYVLLDNKGDKRLQLVQNNTKITVDGEEMGLTKRIDDWDKGWYNEVKRKTEYDGFLRVDDIPEDWQYMTIEMTIRINDGTNMKTEDVTFNIKNKIKN